MGVKKRKRGIRASREKLEAAMLAAGFETQTALAKQIAKNENSEKPPRDLVNKIFREQAVSTHNLARVAKALNVEAHTIYLAKDDSEFAKTHNTQTKGKPSVNSPAEEPRSLKTDDFQHHPEVSRSSSNTSSSKRIIKIDETETRIRLPISKFRLFALLAFISLFCILIIYYYLPKNSSETKLHSAIEAPTGKVRVVLQAPAELDLLTHEIDQQFSESDNISVLMTSIPDSYHLSTFQALNNWQAHIVLKLNLVKERYYTLVTASLGSKQRYQVVLQTVVRTSEMKNNVNKISNALLRKTKQMISGQAIPVSMSISNQALAHYLHGKDLLFSSHSTTSYLNARDYFNRAIQIDPDFAAPYAELCRTYVRISWMQEEATFLEKAASSCQQAQKLQTESLELMTAKAELLARTGKPEEAITLLDNEALTLSKQNADALAIRAAIHLVIYGLQADQAQAQLAETYAKKAISIEPKHWLAQNTLGNLYFSTGQTKKAKEKFAAASTIVKHEVIMANLGTLQLCFDELENATQTYMQLIANFENNYIGYESLGAVYHFKQNFTESLKNRLYAINKQPEITIHQVWGALAETYLRLDDIENAQKYFTKALTLLERDELLENDSVSNSLHKLYYLSKLAYINKDAKSLTQLENKVPLFLLQKHKLGLKERSHLAWMAGLINNTQTRDAIWHEISAICPVYRRSPELILQTAQYQ